MATVAHLRVIEGERRAPPVPDPETDSLVLMYKMGRAAGWAECAAAYTAGAGPGLRLVTAESIRLILEAARS